MSAWQVLNLCSPEELLAEAARWNDLWQRSESVRPTSRAEHLALWCRAFAPKRRFRAIVIASEDRFLAGLPLVETRAFPLRTLRTPGNAWGPSAELLLDPTIDQDAVVQTLLAALRQAGPAIIDCDGQMLASDTTHSYLRGLEAAGSLGVQPRFRVPLVAIAGGWPEYFASRSRNFRRQMRSAAQRAAKSDDVELVLHNSPLWTAEVESLLRECFELEASGWKGEQHGAVLQHACAWRYFQEQARQLASDGELAIATLRSRGKLLAFEYGWQSKRVRAVLKIGYASRQHHLSPGQLLRYHLIQKLFEPAARRPESKRRLDVQWVDFIGPTTRATAAWATHHYDVGRIRASTSGIGARFAVTAWRWRRGQAGPKPSWDAESCVYPAPLPAAPNPAENLLAEVPIQST